MELITEVATATLNQTLSNGTLFDTILLNQTTNITLPIPTFALHSINGYTSSLMSGLGINLMEFVIMLIGIGLILDSISIISLGSLSKMPTLVLGIGLLLLGLSDSVLQTSINSLLQGNPYLNYSRIDIFLIAVGYLFHFKSMPSLLVTLALLSYAII